MSDSLLASSGLLSPSVAGTALALDFMEEEQKRQMTIKAANVSLLHEKDNMSYVMNLIDTPGHVDFSGRVTRSLRAIDGAVVVVDAVEEVMVQTETVTRQAVEERVRPVLYVNKIDRLIKELKLTSDQIQDKLARIIKDFNGLIALYAEPEFREKWQVNFATNTVAMGSAKDRWGFTSAIAKNRGVKFSDVIDAYLNGKVEELKDKSPLNEAILDMAVDAMSPPHVAQKYRIPKIWQGDINSEVGQAMMNCDDNGPIVMCVTNIVVDPQAELSQPDAFSQAQSKKDRLFNWLAPREREEFSKYASTWAPTEKLSERLQQVTFLRCLGWRPPEPAKPWERRRTYHLSKLFTMSLSQ